MTREERAYNYASKKNPSKFTVGEIAKHYDDGYKDAIEKAYEWMTEKTSTKIVEDFKKAMEE